MNDPWDDPEFKEWEADVRANLIPKLAGSALTLSLVPDGESDVKYAVELGFSIMMNKPIILICTPGRELPPKLRALADAILEVSREDMNNPKFAASLNAKIDQVMAAIDDV